ncbi:hypothetical protein G7Y89_g3072 [Cudoniella acicularis]|uniref:Uncharacterized protein n=1 Tax=Cudoniella acicularis TaxID=354080 RepID=A0A8H4W5X9_9HELO|nr:hypothetical protein G7Y89_g3072 [Cudoniella acicularis]
MADPRDARIKELEDMVQMMQREIKPGETKAKPLLAAVNKARKHRAFLYDTMRALHTRIASGNDEDRREAIDAFGSMLKRYSGEDSIDNNSDTLDKVYGELLAYERERTVFHRSRARNLRAERDYAHIEITQAEEFIQALHDQDQYSLDEARQVIGHLLSKFADTTRKLDYRTQRIRIPLDPIDPNDHSDQTDIDKDIAPFEARTGRTVEEIEANLDLARERFEDALEFQERSSQPSDKSPDQLKRCEDEFQKGKERALKAEFELANATATNETLRNRSASYLQSVVDLRKLNDDLNKRIKELKALAQTREPAPPLVGREISLDKANTHLRLTIGNHLREENRLRDENKKLNEQIKKLEVEVQQTAEKLKGKLKKLTDEFIASLKGSNVKGWKQSDIDAVLKRLNDIPNDNFKELQRAASDNERLRRAVVKIIPVPDDFNTTLRNIKEIVEIFEKLRRAMSSVDRAPRELVAMLVTVDNKLNAFGVTLQFLARGMSVENYQAYCADWQDAHLLVENLVASASREDVDMLELRRQLQDLATHMAAESQYANRLKDDDAFEKRFGDDSDDVDSARDSQSLKPAKEKSKTITNQLYQQLRDQFEAFATSFEGRLEQISDQCEDLTLRHAEGRGDPTVEEAKKQYHDMTMIKRAWNGELNRDEEMTHLQGVLRRTQIELERLRTLFREQEVREDELLQQLSWWNITAGEDARGGILLTTDPNSIGVVAAQGPQPTFDPVKATTDLKQRLKDAQDNCKEKTTVLEARIRELEKQLEEARGPDPRQTEKRLAKDVDAYLRQIASLQSQLQRAEDDCDREKRKIHNELRDKYNKELQRLQDLREKDETEIENYRDIIDDLENRLQAADDQLKDAEEAITRVGLDDDNADHDDADADNNNNMVAALQRQLKEAKEKCDKEKEVLSARIQTYRTRIHDFIQQANDAEQKDTEESLEDSNAEADENDTDARVAALQRELKEAEENFEKEKKRLDEQKQDLDKKMLKLSKQFTEAKKNCEKEKAALKAQISRLETQLQENASSNDDIRNRQVEALREQVDNLAERFADLESANVEDFYNQYSFSKEPISEEEHGGTPETPVSIGIRNVIQDLRRLQRAFNALLSDGRIRGLGDEDNSPVVYTPAATGDNEDNTTLMLEDTMADVDDENENESEDEDVGPAPKEPKTLEEANQRIEELTTENDSLIADIEALNQTIANTQAQLNAIGDSSGKGKSSDENKKLRDLIRSLEWQISNLQAELRLCMPSFLPPFSPLPFQLPKAKHNKKKS